MTWLPLLPPEYATKTTSSYFSSLQHAQQGRRMAASVDSQIIVYDMDLSGFPAWRQSSILKLDTKDKEGTLFSMSLDGRFLAVKSATNLVRVWELLEPSDRNEMKLDNADKPMSQIGGDVWIICPDGISSILLRQAGESLYLVLSCPSYLSNRGNVQVLQLPLEVAFQEDSTPSAKRKWSKFLPSLKGRNADDKFGHAIAFTPSSSRTSKQVFRLVVSSPRYNSSQGLVQVFVASDDTIGWSQQGDDLTGEMLGERFGESLAMSEGEQPYLAIGSPGWIPPIHDDLSSTPFDAQGVVRLYHWRSLKFKSPRGWVALKDALLVGNDSEGEFGSAVSISTNGNRLAAVGGSNNSAQSAYVRIYDRESYSCFLETPTGLFQKRSNDSHQAQAFSFNSQGSLLSVVSPSGDVKSFIDVSPFCKVPLGGNGGGSRWREFLERDTCRHKEEMILNQRTCSESVVLFGELVRSCSWEKIPATDSPSSAPSATHSPISPPWHMNDPILFPTPYSFSPSPTMSGAPVDVHSSWPSVGPDNTPSPGVKPFYSNSPSMSPLGRMSSTSPSSTNSILSSGTPTTDISFLRGGTKQPSNIPTAPIVNDSISTNSVGVSLLVIAALAFAAGAVVFLICARRRRSSHSSRPGAEA